VEPGNVEPGKYSYRIVWRDEHGRMKGVELSDDTAVSTLGGNDFSSVRLENLPVTPGPKQIYRTNKSGTGEYQLITTLNDGNQASYLDKASDAERSSMRQTTPFEEETIFGRRYRVRLGNVGEIRVPKVRVEPEEPEPTETDTTEDRGFRPGARTGFSDVTSSGTDLNPPAAD
jgi:hypothetical protein